jgi:uncharacterized cupredoxin-like copper-binding protein
MSRTTCLSILAALLAISLGAPAALAQDATHPLVGAWLVASSDAPPELVAVTADGLVVDLTPNGPAIGVWAATGGTTADVTIVLPVTDAAAGVVGLARARASVEVAGDGRTFSGTYTLEFPTGPDETTGELGPGAVTGTRLEVEAMGTPVGPIPVEPLAPGESPGAGEGAEVGITLQEWAVVPETMSISAGTVTFDVENIGPQDPHELVVVRTDIAAIDLPTREDGGFDEEAAGVTVIGEIEEFAPGTSASATFELEPGHYVFLCNLVEEEEGQLESHYQQGMWVDIEVV